MTIMLSAQTPDTDLLGKRRETSKHTSRYSCMNFQNKQNDCTNFAWNVYG